MSEWAHPNSRDMEGPALMTLRDWAHVLFLRLFCVVLNFSSSYQFYAPFSFTEQSSVSVLMTPTLAAVVLVKALPGL